MHSPVDREVQAAAIVAQSLGACYRKRRQHDHDFDLVFTDRPDEPLEVTTAATGGAIATEKELRRSAARDAPALTNVWSLVPTMSVPAGTDPRSGKQRTTKFPIDELHPVIVDRLKNLEAESIREIPSNWSSFSEQAMRTVSELDRLGVIAGNCRPLEPGETPKVEYVGIYGGVGRADLLLAAVKAEYTEPGNVGKLSGAGDNRHLFIRIDHTAGDAYVALRNAELPARLPELPDVITDVWLWADDLRVFHFTRRTGWVEHAVPEDVLTHPEQLAC